MTDSCAYCTQPGSRHCVCCKVITYCSKACQELDAKPHQQICKPFSILDKATRPSTHHHLAFFFPANEDVPKLIWLETEYMGPQRLAVTEFASIDRLLGRPAYSATPMLVQINERLSKPLDNNVNLWHRDTFLNDGSELNASIFKVAPTSYWRGPIVAVAQVGQDLNPLQNRDVTPTDFRNLVDHFEGYASRLGKGFDSVPDVDLPDSRQDVYHGDGIVQARHSESIVARLARFRRLVSTGDPEAALESMPRETGDEESFATLQRLVEEGRGNQATRYKELEG